MQSYLRYQLGATAVMLAAIRPFLCFFFKKKKEKKNTINNNAEFGKPTCKYEFGSHPDTDLGKEGTIFGIRFRGKNMPNPNVTPVVRLKWFTTKYSPLWMWQENIQIHYKLKG